MHLSTNQSKIATPAVEITDEKIKMFINKMKPLKIELPWSEIFMHFAKSPKRSDSPRMIGKSEHPVCYEIHETGTGNGNEESQAV